MPSAKFEAAAAASRQLKAKPNNDELLQLYALFKIANGEDISKAPAPGMFDLKGKAKHKAWKEEADSGTTATDAETKYIELIDSLKKKYGFDPSKQPEAVGGK